MEDGIRELVLANTVTNVDSYHIALLTSQSLLPFSLDRRLTLFQLL